MKTKILTILVALMGAAAMGQSNTPYGVAEPLPEKYNGIVTQGAFAFGMTNVIITNFPGTIQVGSNFYALDGDGGLVWTHAIGQKPTPLPQSGLPVAPDTIDEIKSEIALLARGISNRLSVQGVRTNSGPFLAIPTASSNPPAVRWLESPVTQEWTIPQQTLHTNISCMEPRSEPFIQIGLAPDGTVVWRKRP